METGRHQGGSSSRRRLGASVRVRLSFEDAARLVAKARADDVSVSDFIRTATLGATGGRVLRRLPTADEAALGQILAQLGKVGSNLNQLARAANSGGWPSEPELVEGAQDVRVACNEIMRVLGRRA